MNAIRVDIMLQERKVHGENKKQEAENRHVQSIIAKARRGERVDAYGIQRPFDGRDMIGKRDARGKKAVVLDVIDVDLVVFAELERALAVLFAKVVGFVDLGVFGKFTVCLHCKQRGLSISRFIRCDEKGGMGLAGTSVQFRQR